MTNKKKSNCGRPAGRIKTAKIEISIEPTVKDEFMTFGDDVGDMDMILNSGVGVAMKNSQPQLLKVAKNITLSNEDDGCAVFINKYFDLKIED